MYKLAILLMIALGANAYHLHYQVYLETHNTGRRVANAYGDQLKEGQDLILYDKRGGHNAQSFCVITDDHDATKFRMRLCYDQAHCIVNSGNKARLGKCTDPKAVMTYNEKTNQVKDTTGKCLDCNRRGTANGTHLIWYGCHTLKNQQWRFSKIYKGANQYVNVPSIQAYAARIHRPVVTQSVYLQTMLAGHRVFDAANFKIVNDAQIHLWDKHGGNNQRWCLRTLTGNKLKLYFCDDPSLCAVNKNNNFTVEKCTDKTWVTYDAKAMTIKDPNGKCADIYYGYTGNGTACKWWNCDGQTKQKFRFKRAAEYINLNNMLLERFRALAAARAAAAEKARLAKKYADAKKRHAALRVSIFRSYENAKSCGTVAVNGRCGRYGSGGTRCSWGYCSRWSWCGAGTDYVRGGQSQYNAKAGCRSKRQISDLKTKWDKAHPAP